MSPVVKPRLPHWLEALAGAPAPRPVKARPINGPVAPDRWQIPAVLRQHDAWAVWRYTQDAAGRWSKPPYQPSGELADGRTEATWSTFDAAWRAYQDGQWDGVSFCLDPRWGLVGVDLDHVSEWRTGADAIVAHLDSYTELSPGHDGFRIFVRGQLPAGRRRRGNVEMYDHHRFLTVTGARRGPHETPLFRQDDLTYVWNHWLQNPPPAPPWTFRG